MNFLIKGVYVVCIYQSVFMFLNSKLASKTGITNLNDK